MEKRVFESETIDRLARIETRQDEVFRRLDELHTMIEGIITDYADRDKTINRIDREVCELSVAIHGDGDAQGVESRLSLVEGDLHSVKLQAATVSAGLGLVMAAVLKFLGL